jgi:hypothetical protein
MPEPTTAVNTIWGYYGVRRRVDADLDAEVGPFIFSDDDHFVATYAIEFSRELDCPHYGDCLDVAALYNWPSLTCSGCYSARVRWANTEPAPGPDGVVN